ncbi:hypothetical protein [Thiohalobacter thiocyanaticus]|uniref:Uncharacterized protein n=1 Tax=Thiohalobacter thiocyanaticus TaxID=585455 RepID=A0A426QG55_9GAMM|nr:hypothetical protein [Thiohalobacter thiocyanaticus]RRQ20713.1 hypothetical protein D6C00_01095 [Thiohalobacter thiocyanaticus]
MSSEEVRDELRSQAADRRPRNDRTPGEVVLAPATECLQRIGDVPIYAVDGRGCGCGALPCRLQQYCG